MWIYRRMGRISWTEKQTNNEVLKTLGMKREMLNEIRSRQIKYFEHIKSKEYGREEDSDLGGWTTSRDGRVTACQSVPSERETDTVGDPLQPTFDADSAVDLI